MERFHFEKHNFNPFFRLPMFPFWPMWKQHQDPFGRDEWKRRPFPMTKKVLSFLLSAIALPPAKDYNLILNRVISLKAHFKHSLKVQDAWDWVWWLSILSFPISFTACETFGFRSRNFPILLRLKRDTFLIKSWNIFPPNLCIGKFYRRQNFFRSKLFTAFISTALLTMPNC